MNKTPLTTCVRALFALLTLTPYTIVQAMPDCTVDESGRSHCFQSFSEGLAAVLMSVVGQPDGRWGFIDARGAVVIPPGYDQVRPFANGLAAAQREGHWGYIDQHGRWVIEPVYGQASSFTASGHALVTRSGELLRVPRSGPAQTVLSANQRAFLHDPVDLAATRWSVSIKPYGQLWDLQQGRIVPIPEGLSNLSIPQDNLIAAIKQMPSGAEHWGLLNLQGSWAMPPGLLRSTEQPVHDHGLVARSSNGVWQFVNLKGEVQNTQTLQEVHLVRPGSWVVAPEDGKWELWDDKAGRVMVLPPDLSVYNATPVRDSVVIKTSDDITLIAPQGKAWQWPLQGRQVHTDHHLLWLLREKDHNSSSPQGSNEIFRLNGQNLLDPGTSARLDEYLITPMRSDDADLVEADTNTNALALLEPLAYSRPPAILTHDARIVSQPEWLHIRPRHDSAELWVAQTREGLFGAIDGQGRWRVPPVWQGLSDFNQGIAWGRRADMLDGRRQVLLDSDGRVIDSPPFISQECTRWIGAVLLCVNDQGAQLQQYLWHPRRQQRVDIPLVKQFDKLAHDLYSVQQGELWGLMDKQGAWRIQPRLANAQNLRLLDRHVGLETVDETEGQIHKRFRLVSLSDGRPLSDSHLREAERMGPDRYLVHPDHEGSYVINALGQIVLKQPWPIQSAKTGGHWASVEFDDLWGVMDLLGQWHVQPRYQHLTGPFGLDQWLLVRTNESDQLIVNAEGQPVDADAAAMEDRPTPPVVTGPPTLQLVQRGSKQVFVNAKGQAVVTAEMQCEQFVLRNEQGEQTWPLHALNCTRTKKKGTHR